MCLPAILFRFQRPAFPESLSDHRTQRDVVGAIDVEGQRLELRAALRAVVAACVHGGRKRLGMAKRAREQGNHEAREACDATLQGTGGKRRATRELGRANGVQLGDELRHESQRNAHHHAELVCGGRERGEHRQRFRRGGRRLPHAPPPEGVGVANRVL